MGWFIFGRSSSTSASPAPSYGPLGYPQHGTSHGMQAPGMRRQSTLTAPQLSTIHERDSSTSTMGDFNSAPNSPNLSQPTKRQGWVNQTPSLGTFTMSVPARSGGVSGSTGANGMNQGRRPSVVGPTDQLQPLNTRLFSLYPDEQPDPTSSLSALANALTCGASSTAIGGGSSSHLYQHRTYKPRRQSTIVVLFCITMYLVWLRGGETLRKANLLAEHVKGFVSASTSASTTSKSASKCNFMPFLPGCSRKRDPFRGLVYDVKDGHLFTPARQSDEDVAQHGPRYQGGPSSPPVPPQPHAIHFLIQDARQKWQDKLASQSNTLDEAATEYRRRYHQNPPLGFDKWFQFAQEHNVQLLDEYDSIYERILPFQSLPRDVLRHRSKMIQEDDGLWLKEMAFTVHVRDHGKTISVDGPMKNVNFRSEQVALLLKGISDLIPTDVDLSITAHDVPWVVIAGEAKENHVAAAREGRYIDEVDVFNFMDNPSLDGWALACPPNAPLRKAGPFEKRMEPRQGHRKSFIKDHELAMDVCRHPDNQPLHGFTAWAGPRPGLLFPMFSFTSSSMHSDLLMPALEQWEMPVGPDPEWEDKTIDKLLWRGSTTGSDLTLAHMRKNSQRPRLCKLPKTTGLVTVDLAPDDPRGHIDPTLSYTEHANELSDAYFDFQFTGYPTQCGDTKTCSEFEAQFQTPAQQNEYKYVLDVDGNGWSGRFHRLMSSNSLVMKSTMFPEWYIDRIQPWVHYVPVSVNYSELWDIMAFFKGDVTGQVGHDRLAKEIALEGKRWAEQYWRWEDMQAYFLRLILEYARVMNKNPHQPTNMDYVN
ncbi:Protein O-glucosyltransferase 2 [Microbotryomycetes sp. JL201]|nr:Protein O-glucosyltransferase 2 [Microbotryomycetes sp. JL201]